MSDIKVGLLGNFQFVDSQRTHCDNFGGKPIIFLANPTRQELNGFNGNTITLTPDIVFDNSLALFNILPYIASLWPITLCTAYFTALTPDVVHRILADNFIMPQLQLLVSKRKK